jgi:cytoskeletal protein CcmA (bactofilin family)
MWRAPSPRASSRSKAACTAVLIARDVVRLLEGSMVRRDVVTPRLGIDDGARFKGKVDGGTRAEAAARVAAYRQTVPGEPAIRR